MKHRKHLMIFILLLLSSMIVTAQKELDSILTASTALLFDKPDQAIALANDILEKSSDPTTKVKALTFMSSAYLSKRQNSKSLKSTLRSLEFLDQIDNPRIHIEVLNALGMQHQQLRMYDKAKDYLDRALVLTNGLEPSDKPSSLLAYNYTIRGFIYREQMNCEIAQNYFDRALFQFNNLEKSTAVTANLSTVYYNKGNCFLQTTQIDSARTSFEKSIAYAKKAHAPSLLAFAKKGLSEVYTAEGSYLLSVQHLYEADSIASEVGDLVLLRGIYNNLANNFLALGNRKQYEFYDNRYQKTQQELLAQERLLIDESLRNSRIDIISDRDEKLKNLHLTLLIILFVGGFLLLFLVRMTLKSRKQFLGAKKELNSPL